MDHKEIDIKAIRTEDGAMELADSEAMRPYMNLALAVVTNVGIDEAIDDIRALALEERYLWRVISALKWAFADFDSVSIAADNQTLEGEDRKRVSDMMRRRPLQFCLLIQTLLGDEGMEETMLEAIRMAKSL